MMLYGTTEYGKDRRPVAEIWNGGMPIGCPSELIFCLEIDTTSCCTEVPITFYEDTALFV